jgi:FlaA1/EpsC-like NDP-sugar epimerase
MASQSLSQRLIRLPRGAKRLAAISFDALLCALTIWLAWCLRLERWVPLDVVFGWATLGAWALGLPIFWRFGLYATIFRHAGWNAMLALGKAAALYGALFALVFTVIGVPGTPRSVGIIQPLLMFVGLGLSRVAVRLWLGDLYRELLDRLNAPGVLIYGAGAAGKQLGASLLKMSSQRLVGFIDDDATLQGRRLDGLPVYPPADLPQVIENFKVRDVLLALPSATSERRKEIIERLLPYPVHVRTLPGMADLVSRGVGPGDLQELDIEDLLGRDPVAPDQSLMASHLKDQVVLVTGAGGSIGSELCRQILRWGPSTLLLLELSEFALYQVNQELTGLAARLPHGTKVVPLLGSAADGERVDAILSAWRPQIIYHAAAYKHVPLVEHNPAQGLHNNVWGTLTCAQSAMRHGVARFVLVSTDKAVRPTNVMGASKRLAEMVLQALAAQAPNTCYTMVRFGNVLGSSGSVVPLFRRQIAAGGPITLTHRDITRYFMTIPEAAQLVIQAGAMAHGGDVFVLDMGESVRIHDLARRMVELTGQRVRDAYTPWGDIEIKITGLRPGEKLYEELLIEDGAQPTTHPRILKAHEDFLPWSDLQRALHQLAKQMEASDHAAMRATLLELVSGYHPQGPVVDWIFQAPPANVIALQSPSNKPADTTGWTSRIAQTTIQGV